MEYPEDSEGHCERDYRRLTPSVNAEINTFLLKTHSNHFKIDLFWLVNFYLCISLNYLSNCCGNEDFLIENTKLQISKTTFGHNGTSNVVKK